ncbi:hypothetical protein [Nonomuraea dietziae]|uniref:hypothetical protein n=1 Tax=Nonomuraea dietziae TaxID=65515 RepID=UPI0031DEA03D
MKILMNAGPWLPVPPDGYGGIENVVATLIPPLRARGVKVVLASVGSSSIEVDELITAFPDGQFGHLQKPYNQVMGLAHAHQARVIEELRSRDDIDLVHDHLEVVGAPPCCRPSAGRRSCTRSTGTCASTRASTAASRPASPSTACRPRSWPAPPRRCRPPPWARSIWPRRWQDSPPRAGGAST